MLDDMDQYPTFASYGLSYNNFDHFDMKRTQDSIGGPESVKKPRQYPPGFDLSLQPQQQSQSYYQAGPQLNAQASGVPASPANLYSSSLNGSIAAPPVLNTMAMSMNGINMNGMGLSGMNGLGGHHQMGQSSPLVGYSNQLNGNSPTSMGGMMPPSPNSAALSNQQQQLFANAQQQYNQQSQQQQNQMTASPGPQQQFLQQQQMNMLNGSSPAMGGLPGMFGAMPMGLPFGFGQMAFQPQGLATPMMNPIQAAAAAAAGNATGRTVYIGNLPADASVDELLNLVHYGPIESVRVLPERSCVFISFLDGPTAASFHADATLKKLTLHGQELKIGWGKPSPVPSQVLLSISQSNASRNVYLGGLDENMTEEMLRDDLSRFGLIDQVKIVRDKNIGFVHFLSISTATKVVATLPTEPAWAGKRVNYGKDRCAYVPKSQQTQTAAAAHAQAVVQQAGLSPLGMTFSPFSPLTPNFGAIANVYGADPNSPNPAALGFAAAAAANSANRTVYLGNIHPDTTIEEMCNTIRGGALQSVRYLPDKHIAFVTFIDPASAFAFHNLATYSGLTLNNRRLKVGWGKHSGALPPSLALSIQAGATRNVYVGNIEDFEQFEVEKLKRDFGEYGEIELVNYLKEKNCAFVNFTNISNAIKAIDGIKNKPEYANLRIAHGKDRCANAPRQPSGNHSARRIPSGATGAAPSSPQPPISPNEGATDNAEPEEDVNGAN